MAKKSKEEWKIWGNVFDNFTLRTLFKLAGQGYFEKLESPVSIGKESNIFTALTKNGRIIVKIYRLESCDFNRMYDYIKYDPRMVGLKKQRRKIIFSWVRREYRNLIKAREAEIRVPKPIAVLNNVLLMEFIGNSNIALKLKDEHPKDNKIFFNKIIENVRKLYTSGLVHADLSQFNILNYDENPVFIDFSQCTSIKDPNAEEYLERDVKNICTFFRKLGLDENMDGILNGIRKV